MNSSRWSLIGFVWFLAVGGAILYLDLPRWLALLWIAGLVFIFRKIANAPPD